MSCKSLGNYYHVDGKQLQKQYAAHLSDFTTWNQLDHAEDWVLFPENMGQYLSIDETALTHGELYTVLTNKEAKGQSGAIVAMIKGTQSDQVIKVLRKMSPVKRNKVTEVTLDMAGSMGRIVKRCFPKAQKVIDRFHVQKLASEAVQEIRIKYRWKAIEQENKEIELAKQCSQSYSPAVLENGDTHRQLLARSRYLLFKCPSKWNPSQRLRAELLFKHYPEIETSFKLSRGLANIYQKTKNQTIALTKLARWYEKVEQSKIESFGTVMRSIQHHYLDIVNFFKRRSTNASAESFNAKIKAFRAQFRGVTNVKFFLYRLTKIYA